MALLRQPDLDVSTSHPGGGAIRTGSPLTAVIAAVACLVAMPIDGALVRQAPTSAPTYGYDVVKVYPHDPAAFTQGLIFRDGFLFESTGLEGRSSLRKVRLETGEVVQRIDVDARYFAEGLTDWGSRLVQLTYTTSIGFVYDLASFARERTFSYQGEGWGLTHDDRRLIMSDGTSDLRFLDPLTFSESWDASRCRDGTQPVDDLNELEFVKGEVLRQRVDDRSHRHHRSGQRRGDRAGSI